MLSKLSLAQKQLLASNPYACPLCHRPLAFSPNQKALACQQGHSFDLAKKGYVNFHPHKQEDFYNHQLFSARKALFQQGFFEPITQTLTALLAPLPPGFVLDAGCGDGSHLHALANRLPHHSFSGTDLSKQAIMLATDGLVPNALWCVGDIANLPYLQGAADIILNILSPANYPSFKTTLATNGQLIKVIPGPFYLQELRQLVDKPLIDSQKDQVFHHLEKSTRITQVISLRDSFSLTQEQYQLLIHMTPLTAGLSISEKDVLLNHSLLSITRDWQVITAQF